MGSDSDAKSTTTCSSIITTSISSSISSIGSSYSNSSGSSNARSPGSTGTWTASMQIGFATNKPSVR